MSDLTAVCRGMASNVGGVDPRRHLACSHSFWQNGNPGHFADYRNLRACLSAAIVSERFLIVAQA